jgi:hypothetical protein
MFGAYAAHVVAFASMLFAASSAMTLFWFVRHLDDRPEAGRARHAPQQAA